MTFRYAGSNWEGRLWVAPPAVRTLGDQITVEYPVRPNRAADGTVASQVHDQRNPSSDHRPHPTTGPGVVRAIDVGVSPDQGDLITEALRESRDRRIAYVIWDHNKFGPATGWKWRPYTGAAHDKHFHVSTLAEQDDNDNEWSIGAMALTAAEQADLSRFLAYIEAAGSDVGFVTQAIEDIREKNAAGGKYAPWTHTHNSGGGLSEDDVKAIINGSQIVAP